MKKYRSMFYVRFLSFTLGYFLLTFLHPCIAYAIENAAFDTVSIQLLQITKGKESNQSFSVDYQLTLDSAPPSFTFKSQEYHVVQSEEKTKNEAIANAFIIFGKDGIKLPISGQYRFIFKPIKQSLDINEEKSSLPTYTIMVDVTDNLTISDMIIWDNITNSKNTTLRYTYTLNQSTNNLKKLPQTGEMNDTQTNQTVKQSDNRLDNQIASNKHLPTLNQIKKQVFRALHLPQTGAKDNRYSALLGCFLLLLVGYIVWFKKRSKGR